jgi:hypothetical protein
MDSVFPAKRSSKHEVPLLRYIYGLPLCEENEHPEVVILASLCEALSFSDDLPGLHDHVLHKLEELLVGLLHGIVVGPADVCSRLRDLDQPLEPFPKQLGDLLKPEHVDTKEEGISDQKLLRMAAKVCCTHFTILGVSPGFRAFCFKHPNLQWSMMYYSALHGGDVLKAGFGTGV